jgi:small subunit ribosomal protein S6
VSDHINTVAILAPDAIGGRKGLRRERQINKRPRPEGGTTGMAKLSANYELMYILDPDIGEEQIAATAEKFKSLIEANGTVNELDEIGKKKLAYLINDKPDGYYILVKFTSGPEFPAELDRVLKITDGIMRSLITVIEN